MQANIKNADLFKSKIGKISKIIPMASITFMKGGILIWGMSPDNVIAIELSIPKKSLAGYRYKPAKSIGLNLSNLKAVLSRFKSIKGNLQVKLQGNKMEISASDGRVKKTFWFPITILDDEPKLPDWKPNVRWKVEGIIDGLSKIWMFTDKGPLVIESVRDDFPLRWIIAPIINECKPGETNAMRRYQTDSIG